MACKTWASVRAEFTQTTFRYDFHTWERGRTIMQRFRLMRIYVFLVVAALGIAIAAATIVRAVTIVP